MKKIKNIIPANASIIHFRDPNRLDKGGLTIAYQWSTTWEGGVKFGIAFCSKNDYFHKKRGVEIALDRMTDFCNNNITIVDKNLRMALGDKKAVRYHMATMLMTDCERELTACGMKRHLRNVLDVMWSQRNSDKILRFYI